jgi:hypothetical protein
VGGPKFDPSTDKTKIKSKSKNEKKPPPPSRTRSMKAITGNATEL